jgi:hypothetical protein
MSATVIPVLQANPPDVLESEGRIYAQLAARAEITNIVWHELAARWQRRGAT